MRVLSFMLQKEFLQIFRNKMMLPILFVMPIIQLLILANAATFELTSVPVYVVDQDRSGVSRQVVSAFMASDFFELVGVGVSTEEAVLAMDRDEVKVVVVLPGGMDRALVRQGVAGVHVLIDAVDGFSAGVAQGYVLHVLGAVSSALVTKRVVVQDGQLMYDTDRVAGSGPVMEWSHWFNPTLEYIPFMVPGILVVLVTMIGGFLSGMNVVREREIGTMEQLNVTPISRSVFIIGKLLPFWIIALVELGFGLIVAAVVFGLVSEGSLLLIFGSAAVFMFVILGIGLFVSTISDTQQQAMFITWFILVLFILMGGLFTPIDSMPEWAQMTTWVNPMAWYIDLMRRVMLTGAGLEHVWKSIMVLAVMGGAVLGLAVKQSTKSA
jgi:ABC-2 type transport system permease protein